MPFWSIYMLKNEFWFDFGFPGLQNLDLSYDHLQNHNILEMNQYFPGQTAFLDVEE